MKNLLTLFLLLIRFSVHGQNTNNYWYFGDHAGVVFDSSGAHSTAGNVFAAEGVASISDGCGLLFYTDGDTVWNRNHEMMTNGFDIGGKCVGFTRSSSTQAALVVREPASDSVFYIFTTDCIEDYLVDGLRYSIVDMNRSSGLGQVVLKNQLLMAATEEKLTAAKHANGCDVWIISHDTTNLFYSYLLSDTGLNLSPVVSTAGQILGSHTDVPNARGYLKASPNGEKLINVNLEGAYSWADTSLPEVFNFDKLTGIVTSDFVFPPDTANEWNYSSWTIPFYGASFSPDNSKLYLSSGFYGPHLLQYDLNADSVSNIIASRTLLSPFPWVAPDFPCSIVNAPDGKIYIAHLYRGYLGTINHPDSAGLACNYVDSAFNLANGTANDWGGLPNFFEDYINPKLLKADFSYSQPTTADTIFFINSSIAANNFIWYFGDGAKSILQNPFHVYADTGYYAVSLFAKDSSCDVDRICKTIYVLPAEHTRDINETTNDLNLIIMPNPFNDELSFQLHDDKKTELSLYNFLGQQILQQKFTSSTTINTEQLADGIYFYELRNNKGTIMNGKVVKQ